MGPLGKLWVEICIIGYLMGCCIAYIVVLGDLGPEILAKVINKSLNIIISLNTNFFFNWQIGFNYSLQSSRILLMAGIDELYIFT